MKKVFLIGALALGMMSFTQENQNTTLDVGFNCFSVWTNAYNAALASGYETGAAVEYAASIFNECVANSQSLK